MRRRGARREMKAEAEVEVEVVSPQQARELTSLSPRQLPRLEAEGRFPQHVRLTARRIGYVRAEVLAWTRARADARARRARSASERGAAA
jgi:predicted DNA-binding transcriptional regulator AlpA